MFFNLLYIHLFRPFLKYNTTNSPLPSHVSPRKVCSQAAGAISKLMRLYKRTYGLRQICNIAVYIVHSACTIHLLNLPEKTARRDIIHGVKHLEEIAEDWLCARRTLSILSVLARKWKIDLPEEAAAVFTRADTKYGHFSTADVPSPKIELVVATPPPNSVPSPQATPARSQPQSQLQQSMYSYAVDGRPLTANSMQIPTTNPPNNLQQARITSNGVGSMSTMPNQQLISSVPYGRYADSATSVMTPGNDLPRNSSASEASGSLTRQVSPNTLFGGVEALVESQDWWLRDQANLYGNWMSFSGPQQDANGTSPTSGPSGRANGGPGVRGYYPGTNGNMETPGNSEDWSY